MDEDFDKPANDAINSFLASKADPKEREQLSEMFFGENATMPAGIRQDFQDFVAGEQDSAWKEQRAAAAELDPSNLLNRLKILETKLDIREVEDSIKEEEEPKVDIIEAGQNNDEAIAEAIRSITGTGYNLGVRDKSGGGFEIFGRYNGPFYAEPKHNANLTGKERYSNILRVYNGVVYAGNSSWEWPGGDLGSAPEYVDFKFDHSTLAKSPSGAAGNWIVYIEVAVFPAATKCDSLWGVGANDGSRYIPILRAHKSAPAGAGTYPDQSYSISDHTQADDLVWCALAGGVNPYTRINPRGMDLKASGEKKEDILVGKFILGTLTIGVNDGSTATRIEKWAPRWHASDIYCPVWQWNHCTDADGIEDYPDTDTLECIYGASLCSPTCFTPWDYFTDHYHKSGGVDSGFPYEDDCGLDGSGPADHQGGG